MGNALVPPYPNFYPGMDKPSYRYQPWLTEEEVDDCKRLIATREDEIKSACRHFFGVEDPVKIIKKSKKKEYFCNEGGCRARTTNLGAHLQTGKHALTKEKSAFVVSWKVSSIVA